MTKQQLQQHYKQPQKRKNQSKAIQQKAFENITNNHYEQLADQYAKTEASKILKSKAKRAVIYQACNELKHELDKQDAGEKIAAQNRYRKVAKKIRGVNKLEKAQKQNAFNSFQDVLEEHKNQKETFKPLIQTGDPNLKPSPITPLEEAIKKNQFIIQGSYHLKQMQHKVKWNEILQQVKE